MKLFLAKISSRKIGGEICFDAVVSLAGSRVFTCAERPSQNHVQCEVLEWAQRTGKTGYPA